MHPAIGLEATPECSHLSCWSSVHMCGEEQAVLSHLGEEGVEGDAPSHYLTPTHPHTLFLHPTGGGQGHSSEKEGSPDCLPPPLHLRVMVCLASPPLLKEGGGN